MTTPQGSGQTRDRLPPADLPQASSLVSSPAALVPPTPDAVVPRPGSEAQPNDLGPFVHQYLRDYINLADQKAAFVFTAATALMVYAERVEAVKRVKELRYGLGAKELAALATLLLLSLAALAAVAVIRPSLKGKLRHGVIYWDEIRMTDMAGYLHRATSLSLGAAQNEILSHSYVLAGIAQRKYGWLAKSLWLGIAGFSALLGYVFL